MTGVCGSVGIGKQVLVEARRTNNPDNITAHRPEQATPPDASHPHTDDPTPVTAGPRKSYPDAHKKGGSDQQKRSRRHLRARRNGEEHHKGYKRGSYE